MSVILANNHGDHQWTERKRPACLETRIQFFSYDETRAFLDSLADLSEREDLYPDLSFGTNYVNITIRPEREGELVDDVGRRFAQMIDEILVNGESTQRA